MSVAEQIGRTAQNLVASRKMVTQKNGTVGSAVAFDNLADEIMSITASEGEQVLVDDTDTAYRKSILNGAQKYAKLKSIGGMTYKCSNLIPFPYYNGKDAGYTETINGVTWTVNADGSITANGTATASSAFSLWGSLDFHLPKGIYTLSGAQPYVGVYINAYKNNAYVTEAAAHNGVNRTFDWTDIEYTSNGVMLIAVAGQTFNNVIIKPMLNLGTTALPYEPYFEGLRDTKVTAIRSHGANLAKMVNGTYDLTADYTVTLTNGHISVHRKAQAVAYGCSSLLFKPYTQVSLPAGKYTIAFNNLVKEKISNAGLYVIKSNGENIINGSPITNSYTFTLANADTIAWGIYMHEATDYAVEGSLEADVMLNYGTTAEEYKPYREPITYALPEALQGSGKGVAGYADTTDFENGKNIKRCYTLAFNGSENWQEWTSGTRFYYMAPPYAGTETLASNFICTHFGYGSSDNNRGLYVQLKVIRAYVAPLFPTLDEWKSYLAKQYANGNPVTLTYALAEPIETDFIETIGNIIEIEEGGFLEFDNKHGNAMPSHISYLRRL